MPIQIAIDGPAGAGKGTTAAAIAEKLHLLYLDTGAMYRAVGLFALRNGISTGDEAALEEMLKHLSLDVTADPKGIVRVYIQGEDVTHLIRSQEVSMAASDVSRWPSVRHDMVSRQREIAGSRDVILEGRDIGTDVLPDATVKIFLTASPEERAKRRTLQLASKGEDVAYEDVLAQILIRDKQDMGRAASPLRPAEGSVIIDSTDLSETQVVDKILGIIKQMNVFAGRE
ncbi:MAG: (d)CMP kinase [Christensenellales bacterium]|jgi:cytidylate kinase